MRIVVTGDFLRFKSDGTTVRLDQLSNIKWLTNILRAPLEVCGGTVEYWPVSNTDTVLNQYLSLIKTSKNRLVSPEEWADLYDRSSFSEEEIGFFKKYFDDCLIIAFECPNFLKNLCLAAGIALIEVIFHPVRFMPDLMLGFSSANGEVQKVLKSYQVSQLEMRAEAGLIKATNQRLEDKNLSNESEKVLLFAGQTIVDRSLIKNKILLDIHEYRSDIENIVKNYDRVILKPHPFMINNTKNKSILMRFFRGLGCLSKFNVTSQNIYWLMCQPAVKGLMTISSGTGVEASYFGLNIHYLHQYPWSLENFESKNEDVFYPILQDFMYPDFWQQTLGCLGHVVEHRAVPSYKFRARPNRLRKSVLQGWGFSSQDFGVEKRLYDIEEATLETVSRNTHELAIELERLKIAQQDCEFAPVQPQALAKLERCIGIKDPSLREEYLKAYFTKAQSDENHLKALISLTFSEENDLMAELKKSGNLSTDIAYNTFVHAFLTLRKSGGLSQIDLVRLKDWLGEKNVHKS